MKSLQRGILFISFWVSSCQQSPTFTTLEGEAQGTTFKIVYESTEDFSHSIDSLFRVIDHSMSLWDSTSILRAVNTNQPSIKVDYHFEKVFEKSQSISQITNGAFDITVGPLVKAWGFSYKKGMPFPSQTTLDSLRRLIGYQSVQLKNAIVQKQNPNTEIDFNAIAQGYTVDVMAGFLEAKGIQNYLVEIGGEVRALGHNQHGKIWQVGIDKPISNSDNQRQLQAVVALNGQALATSGSYRKFVVREGQKFSHAIDPKTGIPITHNLLSVSVIADDCMTADAFATAFLVMGLEAAKKIAPNQNLEFYGIYTTTDGTFQTYHTSGFFYTPSSH